MSSLASLCKDWAQIPLSIVPPTLMQIIPLWLKVLEDPLNAHNYRDKGASSENMSIGMISSWDSISCGYIGFI